MKAIGIIPARYASTRFPGKPLAMILGKSMIRRVYEQASQASCLDRVIVATDDARIFDHVIEFGGEVRMTSEHHPSGTDRIHEVMQQLESESHHYNIVVNIQGDEPFLRPDHISQLVACFDDAETGIATLGRKISDTDTLFDPNCVKVVRDTRDFALYFSRNPIPYFRNAPQEEWINHHTYLKHIGIYAYRTSVLNSITALGPGKLELAESLEQLRWLENGFRIRVGITSFESLSVDRPEDLLKLPVDLNENPEK
jgi:3-deoxy-manno-octulosonate cytidylyltransferase (CMP-KDO synthetase)